MNEKRYILWDRKDGPRPPRDDEGEFLTAGALGEISENNVYLTTYARWPIGARRPGDLEVGESIPNVAYSLSGERGEYDVYRVR